MNHHADAYRSSHDKAKAPFDYSLLNPHLKHLPPRSKTGCWTCRKRKVKCGEERPICAQCVRLGQHCDYEVKYSFKDANKTLVGKSGDLHGNPAWDQNKIMKLCTMTSPDGVILTFTVFPSSTNGSYIKSSRSSTDQKQCTASTRKPRLSPSSDLDDTPGFTTLSTEEDRERKATFHEPGKFYVVANQDSFSSLPEYSQSSTRRSSSTLGASSGASGRASRSTRYSQGESDVSPAGDDTVILNRFEMPTDRPTEKKNPSPPATALRTRISPIEQRNKSHQLPLPPPIPHHTQSSYSSSSYPSQPSRPSYQPTRLDTSTLQYYNNPPSSSSSTYTPQSQQPSPPFPRPPQFPTQIPTQYPSTYQYAPMVPQDPQQYAPFSRLLPQPTLPAPNSMQQQQHHQLQHLSTLLPPPQLQQPPFASSTSYTHHSAPSTYHYATTSPTSYTQSPSAYSSTPSYTQTLPPAAASYTQTSPGASATTPYDHTQSQSHMYAQSYTDATKYEKTSPQETPPPSTMYGFGWGQAPGVQQARQSAQEQGYTRYREYQGR